MESTRLELTPAEVLASAALGGAHGHPVLEAIAAARAGQAADLAPADPLILVDVIRFLAILGEHATVDQAYAAWSAQASGAVHFEAGLAALMVPDLDKAEARLFLAIAPSQTSPQPMAWNSLAILQAGRLDLRTAIGAVEAGMAAMPGDPVTARTAAILYALRGESQRAELDPGDPRVAQLRLLPRRLPAHAQIAIEAAHLLSRPTLLEITDRELLAQVRPPPQFEAARAHLLRRAAELTPQV